MGDFIKKLRHELNYLKKEDIVQIFVFVLAIIPSFFYAMYVKAVKKRIWLICEDKMEARDNGFCFFRYVCKQKDITVYYAIDRRSCDYEKVRAIGKCVQYGSIWHWILYFTSEYNISSQKAGRPGAAVGYVLEKLRLIRQKYIFLQHGITINKAEWLFYKNTRMKLFVCGAKPEYEYVRQIFGYPPANVKYLGFCRFDDYFNCNVNANQIVLMPSWREWIGSKNEYSNVYEDISDFSKTEYYQKYQSLINNEKLMEFLKENNIVMYFYPHRNMQQFIQYFNTGSPNIHIVSNKDSDIRKLLIESAVMVTDYSSVALDFAYMKKPVVYYQFDEKRFREAHYAEGYYSYRGSGLGKVVTEEEEVVEQIIELYSNNLELTEEFYLAHKKFFPIWDDKNCERIYRELLKGCKEKYAGAKNI